MRLIKEIFSWILTILIAIIIGSALNIFVIQPTMIDGESMESTLHDRDTVLVSKLSHTFHLEPEYGDIVIIDKRVSEPRTMLDDITDCFDANLFVSLFKSNNKNDQDLINDLFKNNTNLQHKKEKPEFYIKRVIGKPGDIIEFKEDKVLLNGAVLIEPYIREKMRNEEPRRIMVPPQNVFVMGDNRNYSKDSRQIGCVPYSHVVGRFVCKVNLPEFLKIDMRKK